MRLRVTIQRNALPAAKLLWNVPDTNSTQAYTISRLLEDINHVIPLEAEHWGLEHYVVEVGGFECLHFSPVFQALKEDDEVCIRPLMTAEERARTLTGRHQISNDGRHLVDGVPFGKPYLRHPNRPSVRIPPRKRQRDEDVETQTQDVATLKRRRVANVEAGSHVGVTSATATGQRNAVKVKKNVQFEPQALLEYDDSNDYENTNIALSDERDVATDSSDDSDYDCESDEDTSSASSSSGSDSDSDSDSESDSGSSDSGNESGASSPPEVQSSKGGQEGAKLATPRPLVVPGQGRKQTRARNVRRTRSNRLRHLKEAGVLGPEATLKDLAAYEGGFDQNEMDQTAERQNTEIGQPADEQNAVSNEDCAGDQTELYRRKQQLLERLGAHSGEAVHNDEVSMPQTNESLPVASLKPSSDPKDQGSPEKETTRKRLRPDISAIGRILVRQAMASKAITQSLLLELTNLQPASKKSKQAQPAIKTSPEPEGASDPEFWKSRINVSAFECWEEDFELTAPPYPFKQHWDPASQLMRQKQEDQRTKKGRKNKRKSPPSQDDEEDKIVLQYDDVPEGDNQDKDVNTAIEDQLRQDEAVAAQADLPPLPANIAGLPDLTSSDIREGAIIACKFFVINPVTVQPEISNFKTAIVEREGDSGLGAGTIHLKIAQRDLPPKKQKKFDKNGNQILDIADQFFVEDEEEEEGLWEGLFSELVEPKLLQAA